MKVFIFLILIFSTIATKAQLLLPGSDSLKNEIVAIPVSKGYVNDREKVFTADEKKQIRELMIKYRFDSNTVSVLTIADIAPFNNIQELAIAYANGWELGWTNKNGVLFAFSKNQKKSTVQIGEALASKITNEQLNYLDKIMIQQFVNQNYAQGVLNALTELSQLLQNNLTPKN
jgi:uncharacterized membrane protein YgcG